MILKGCQIGNLSHITAFASHRVQVLRKVKHAQSESANLSHPNVMGCRFGKGIRLTAAEKMDLQQRGAIFDEATGDRSSVSSPFPSRR
jgi:hypothetical protein